ARDRDPQSPDGEVPRLEPDGRSDAASARKDARPPRCGPGPRRRLRAAVRARRAGSLRLLLAARGAWPDLSRATWRLLTSRTTSTCGGWLAAPAGAGGPSASTSRA